LVAVAVVDIIKTSFKVSNDAGVSEHYSIANAIELVVDAFNI
jgi:hypothetical protein